MFYTHTEYPISDRGHKRDVGPDAVSNNLIECLACDARHISSFAVDNCCKPVFVWLLMLVW